MFTLASSNVCREYMIRKKGSGLTFHENFIVYNTFWTCYSCNRGIVLLLEINKRKLNNDNPDFRNISSFKIVGDFPKPYLQVPADVPPDMAKIFDESKKLYAQMSYELCALGMRKVLEMVMADKGEPENDNLYKQVSSLLVKNVITPDMKSWADEIRLLGNVAGHTRKPVEADEAEEIVMLTEYFLTYIYTLPKLTERRRSKREAGEATGQEP
jgi:hypothetical protein